MKENEQEKETIKHCRLPVILNWEKTTRRMRHKISNGHFAGRDKRRDARQKSKSDEKSANQLNPGTQNAEHFRWHTVSARRKSQDFLSAVTGKHQTDNQSSDTKHRTCKSRERVHGRSGCTMSIGRVNAEAEALTRRDFRGRLSVPNLQLNRLTLQRITLPLSRLLVTVRLFLSLG